MDNILALAVGDSISAAREADTGRDDGWPVFMGIPESHRQGISDGKSKPLVEFYKQCHDCGRFLKKARWVKKDHPRKKHGLCASCFANYDDPYLY